MAKAGKRWFVSTRVLDAKSHDQTTADAKVPSVVMYDPLGRPRAFGAASDDDATLLDAEDEWTKCEW
jgi:hypothetical protein